MSDLPQNELIVNNLDHKLISFSSLQTNWASKTRPIKFILRTVVCRVVVLMVLFPEWQRFALILKSEQDRFRTCFKNCGTNSWVFPKGFKKGEFWVGGSVVLGCTFYVQTWQCGLDSARCIKVGTIVCKTLQTDIWLYLHMQFVKPAHFFHNIFQTITPTICSR